MTSEIRSNTLKNRVGLGTVSFTNTGPVVSGIVTANTLRLPDSTSGSLGRVQFGNGFDLSLFHNGSNSFLINNTGYLSIQSQDGVNGIFIARNAEVNLYYGPSVRLQTSSSGVTINRDLDVDGHTNLDNVSVAGVTTITSSASSALYVAGRTVLGNTQLLPSLDSGTKAVVADLSGNGNWVDLTIFGGRTGRSILNFGDHDDQDVGAIEYFHSDNSLNFFTNGSTTEKLRIDSNGTVSFYSPAAAWAEGPVVLEASNGYGAIFFRSTGSTHGTSVTGTWSVGKLAGSDGFAILKNGMTGGGAARADAAINITNAGDTKIGFNLAVGHNNPSTRLDVKQDNAVAYNNRVQPITYGAARFLNTSGHQSGGTYTGFQFNLTGDSQNRICSIGMISEASNSRNSSLVFATDDNGNRTEKLRIDSNGILIINQTSASGTKLAIQSTATSGSGTATGIRVGNNINALTQYPANIEVRTTGVENYNAIRTDAGDGNGGFTCGVQGYNGFLDLTTGGSNTIGLKLRASGASYINGGDLLIGRTSSGAHSNANELQIGSGSGTSGLTIFSATTDGGSIYYADGTSGDARYRGFLEYYHGSDSLAIGVAGDEKFRFASNGSNGDLRLDIGTGQQAQIVAMSGNSNAYNLGSSGGAAIRFMDSSSSHTIEFDTHWTGNHHSTALKLGRTGSLITRDNRDASIGRDWTSGSIANGQSVNWNGSGADAANGRLNANSIGGNGGGHITCLSVSSQDGNPSGAQIITGVHGQGFNSYVTHASNFDSGISVTFNGTWTIANSSGETIYYRINVIHMGTSTTTYYGR